MRKFSNIPTDVESRIKILLAILSEKQACELAKLFCIHRSNITHWKTQGIPITRIQTLMLKFPKLKAWDLLKAK